MLSNKEGGLTTDFTLILQADADGNGTIDYGEFIAATMHINRLDREEHLYSAFQHFDKDNSGYITMEELEQALREFGMSDGRDIKEIISEVDGDNVRNNSPLETETKDGRINYDEFVAMMRKGNPDPIPKKRPSHLKPVLKKINNGVNPKPNLLRPWWPK
ncbi:hypothetical protein YC2023_034454 [Brassica napus]